MNWRRASIAIPLAFLLSACGETWGERVVTGGGMGAGTGLAIGAVAGWPFAGFCSGGRSGGSWDRRRNNAR